MRIRFIAAFLVAVSLSLGLNVVNAQIICTIPCPVWDISAILRNTAINELKGRINDLLDQQGEKIADMSKRLSTVTDLAKYVISLDDTPEWRIHDWFTDAVLFAKDFHAALTYGDSTGGGYASVSMPRVSAESLLAGLSPDGAAYLRSELATLDLADSTIISGTNDTGTVRYNGRKELLAIDALNTDVTDPSEEQSATAVLDKISGAELVATRQQQARIQLFTAALQQLVVDSKRDRDRDAMQMNMTLNALRAMNDISESGTAPSLSLVDNADDALRTWRQP